MPVVKIIGELIEYPGKNTVKDDVVSCAPTCTLHGEEDPIQKDDLFSSDIAQIGF
jgi:hypothetical protein